MALIEFVAVTKGVESVMGAVGASGIVAKACTGVVNLKHLSTVQKAVVSVGTFGLSGAAGLVAGQTCASCIESAYVTGVQAHEKFQQMLEESKKKKEGK